MPKFWVLSTFFAILVATGTFTSIVVGTWVPATVSSVLATLVLMAGFEYRQRWLLASVAAQHRPGDTGAGSSEGAGVSGVGGA